MKLADFKRKIQVGTTLHCLNHAYGDMGTRTVSIVRSNSFALTTTRKDGKIVDSWCEYPKAHFFESNSDNAATFFWGEGAKKEPILTYTFVNQDINIQICNSGTITNGILKPLN